MCNCEKVLSKKAEGGRASVWSRIERYGYSIICIQLYRKYDGLPSKHNRHAIVNWKYCPFCGERIKRGD